MAKPYFRIVCIGDSAAGKTTLCRTMAGREDATDPANTIGAEIYNTAGVFAEDREICLVIWDTAGQKRYRSLVPLYMRYADVFVLVIDASSPRGSANLSLWVDLVRQSAGADSSVVLVLNKVDVVPRCVTAREIEEFAERHSSTIVAHVEVSALMSTNIGRLKTAIYDTAMARDLVHRQDSSPTVAIARGEGRALSCNCGVC